MNQILGTIHNGQVVLDSQMEWPDGTRVELHAVSADVPAQPSGEELNRLMDEMGDIVDAASGSQRSPLSDYAVSRAGRKKRSFCFLRGQKRMRSVSPCQISSPPRHSTGIVIVVDHTVSADQPESQAMGFVGF